MTIKRTRHIEHLFSQLKYLQQIIHSFTDTHIILVFHNLLATTAKF